ncbi:MAG: hypothetical protein GX081_09235 [Firmicutes bacterium]|nr:hypothetical protein [Bacillota bacterium]
MRKLWLFPMLFFILLLVAGGFRWGEGPLQSLGDYQVLHTKDRWTGQRWIILYGGASRLSAGLATEPYPLYSGEWLPYFTQEELDTQLEAVLSRPEYQRKYSALQEQIKELEAEIAGQSASRRPDDQAGEGRTIQEALADATWELNSLYATARKILLDEYKVQAKKKEWIATGVWGFLLLLTFCWALHYFLDEVKRWKQVNETYEIVEYVTKNNRYPLVK